MTMAGAEGTTGAVIEAETEAAATKEGGRDVQSVKNNLIVK